MGLVPSSASSPSLPRITSLTYCYISSATLAISARSMFNTFILVQTHWSGDLCIFLQHHILLYSTPVRLLYCPTALNSIQEDCRDRCLHYVHILTLYGFCYLSDSYFNVSGAVMLNKTSEAYISLSLACSALPVARCASYCLMIPRS